MSETLDLSAKAALRANMRAKRRRLAMEHPEAHWQAGEHAAALVEALKLSPGVVGAYRAVGSEMDPRPLLDALLEMGWQAALPVCVAPDAPIVFRAWRPDDSLAPDASGGLAPSPTAAELDPDLIIAPLLAFDARGARLGQGGGYYDRTLAVLRARRPRPVVGLAFSGQEAATIPVEPHDQLLDAVLTETGYRPLP